jgi:hypothetical protein
MWQVSYYPTGGKLTVRTFPSLRAATEFMVYKICSWDVHDCCKVY